MLVLSFGWALAQLPATMSPASNLPVEQKTKLLQAYYNEVSKYIQPSAEDNPMLKQELNYGRSLASMKLKLKHLDVDDSVGLQFRRIFKYNCLLNKSKIRQPISTNKGDNCKAIDMLLCRFYKLEAKKYFEALTKSGKIKKKDNFLHIFTCFRYFHRVFYKISSKECIDITSEVDHLSTGCLLMRVNDIYYPAYRRTSTPSGEESPDYFGDLIKLVTYFDKIADVTVTKDNKKEQTTLSSHFIEETDGFLKKFNEISRKMLQSVEFTSAADKFKTQLYLELIHDRIDVASIGFELILSNDQFRDRSDFAEKVLNYISNMFMFSLFDLIDQNQHTNMRLRLVQGDESTTTCVNCFIDAVNNDTILSRVNDLNVKSWLPSQTDVVKVLKTQKSDLLKAGNAPKGIMGTVGEYVPKKIKTGAGYVGKLVNVKEMFTTPDDKPLEGLSRDEVDMELEFATRFVQEKEDDFSTEEEYSPEEKTTPDFARKKVYSLMQMEAILKQVVERLKAEERIVFEGYSRTATLYYELQRISRSILDQDTDPSSLKKLIITSGGAVTNSYLDEVHEELRTDRVRKYHAFFHIYAFLSKLLQMFKGDRRNLNDSFMAFLKCCYYQKMASIPKTRPKKATESPGSFLPFLKYSSIFLFILCLVLLLIRSSPKLPNEDESRGRPSRRKRSRK